MRKENSYNQDVSKKNIGEKILLYIPVVGSVRFATFETDLGFGSVRFEENANRSHRPMFY